VASTTGVSRASTSASTSISDSPGRALLYKHSQSVLTVRRAGLAGLSMLLIGGVLGLMLTPTSAPSSIPGPTRSARSQPVFGTCPAQPSAAAPLRWDSNPSTADHICCKNHRYAEYSGYWTSTSFPMTATEGAAPLTFYDPTTGRPLFVAPRGRSYAEFISESKHHGWPSFRDAEVVWENVVVVKGGETISVNGTHLGHNIPDGSGNRYCINIVCVAGQPPQSSSAQRALSPL